MRYRRWAPEEIEQLKTMIAAQASANRIAVALKRPVKSVFQRARSLGMSLPTITEERRRVRNMLKQDDPLRH
jgi:hypothetical protein